MTPRKQIQWVSENPEDADMLHRLAVRAQVIALQFGIELTYEAAIARARVNLAHVRKMAGGVR